MYLKTQVEVPSDKTRQAWAASLLRRLDPEHLTVAGMLADLDDDCVAFLRHWDEGEPDTISCSTIVSVFREYLKKEYIEAHMWNRRETYAKKLEAFLAERKVLPFGDEFLSLRKPSKEHCQSINAAARVANVATQIRNGLRGEIPKFGIQRLFSCLQLDRLSLTRGLARFASAKSLADADSEGVRRESVRLLCRHLKWTGAQEAACVTQYTEAYREAQAMKARTKEEDRDVWAQLLQEKKQAWPLVKQIVRMALGFLVTETECERSFAAEKRVKQGRPRLQTEARHTCLKVPSRGWEKNFTQLIFKSVQFCMCRSTSCCTISRMYMGQVLF